MPTLDWIGKQAVVNHHREVPFRLLHCARELSVGDPDSGNLVVQGDNLLALKALLPYYAGKVKCIYIDPPYNTGNEGWVYNDNVNSPEIRRWLGEVVGKEAEDLSRHDKWLCMMYPRLAVLKDFLSNDGILFASIDDNEEARLRLLLDELFGPNRFIAKLVWKSRHFTDTRPLNGVSADHEYVLAYGRSPGARLRGKEKDWSKYKNPDDDLRGPWTSCSLLGKATREQRPNLHYDFRDPVTGDVFPCPPRTGWICAPETMARFAVEHRLLYPRRLGGRLRLKVFRNELKSEFMGFPSVMTDFATSDGTSELREIFGDQVFSFPKPSGLVKALIEQIADSHALVLDSFAGTGTTGHAVLAANASDGGGRRFILVEMDPNISQNVTRRRLQRVIDGYDRPEAEKRNRVEGLGGGFRYCRLGEPLFDEAGQIRETVKYADLAAHVFFSETGSPIPRRVTGKSPLLGVFEGRAVYLLYNGVLGDRRANGGNVLTASVLAELPSHDGPRVVYGEACRLGKERLAREGVVFRQVPYQVRTG